MILVTGANGHFGKLTIDFLLEKGMDAHRISALVRAPHKARNLKEKGVNIVLGDYDNYTSLVKAFTGCEKLLFVSGTDLLNRTAQHERIVKAAIEADVKHIIYTSGELKAETPDSPLFPFTEVHLKTEKWLQQSGLKYTILKNGLYMDFIPFFIGNVLETEMIYLPAGEGKISVVLRSEMAEATAAILSSEGHEEKVYHFVNSQAYGYRDIADYISEITGKTIRYISPSEAEFRDTLQKNGVAIPEELISIVLAQALGEGEITSYDIEELIGRKLTPLKSFLQQVYKP